MTKAIKSVLIDADALVALAKTNDTNHQQALLLNQYLQENNFNYYLSPFTIAETVTVLSHKTTHQAAKDFLKQIRSINISTLELPEKHQTLVDSWFNKQTQKGTSFFDCYNLALLDHFSNQIAVIFSFDSVYKKNGFTTLTSLASNQP